MIRSKILIKNHIHDAYKPIKQRRWWLFASSLVYICIIFLIIYWDWINDIHQKALWWVIITITICACANWWYWTMNIVSQLLSHQQREVEFIQELLHDINELKHIISNIDKEP